MLGTVFDCTVIKRSCLFCGKSQKVHKYNGTVY